MYVSSKAERKSGRNHDVCCRSIYVYGTVKLVNLDETVSAMYPLMQPAAESLADQIITKQSTENISYDKDNQYTSMVLLNAVNDALTKAEVE